MDAPQPHEPAQQQSGTGSREPHCSACRPHAPDSPHWRPAAGTHSAPATPEQLGGYDRVTVALWERSYRALWSGASTAIGGASGAADPTVGPTPPCSDLQQPVPPPAFLASAAVHALLPGLRRCTGLAALLAIYADSAAAAADFALIDSLVPAASPDPVDPHHHNDERRWQLRDAAFHVRWLELAQPPGSRCQSCQSCQS